MGGQLDGVLFGGLAQPEVCDFDPPLVEEDVLGFEVVVDDLVRQLVEVADGTHHLPNDQLRLPLRDPLVLFEIEGQIGTLAELQDCAEGVGVDLDSVVQSHDIGVAEHLVNCVLPHRVLDVGLLGLTVPLRVELVHFHSHLLQLLHIVGLIHLAETSPPQQTQQLVLTDEGPTVCSESHLLPVAGAVLLVEQPVFLDVEGLLLLKAFQSILTVGFLPGQEVGLAAERDFPLLVFLDVLAPPGLFFGPVQLVLFFLQHV